MGKRKMKAVAEASDIVDVEEPAAAAAAPVHVRLSTSEPPLVEAALALPSPLIEVALFLARTHSTPHTAHHKHSTAHAHATHALLCGLW
jgi:hypothetical protein